MFAPMQDAYEKEAKGMESLKMHTLSYCKERTVEDGPANYSACSNFAYIVVNRNLRRYL